MNSVDIDIENIDIERLRQEVIYRYATMGYTVNAISLKYASEAKRAPKERLIEMAISLGIDLKEFTKRKAL